MLTIEDCLEQLDVINWDPPVDNTGKLLSISNTWDRRFISDVSFHTRQNNPISTAQGTLALKLINRYRNELQHSSMMGYQLDALLSTPQYRHSPHESLNFSREVRWLGDSKLAFRSKYNPGVGEDIKKLRASGVLTQTNNGRGASPRFSKPEKSWIVQVDLSNVERVMEVIRRHCFKFDDNVAEFLTEVSNSKDAHSSARLSEDSIHVEVRGNEFMSLLLSDLHWIKNV
jgi:hypothetical protein